MENDGPYPGDLRLLLFTILYKDDGGRAHQGLPHLFNVDSHPRIAIQGSARLVTENQLLTSSFLLICLALLDKVWIDAETSNHSEMI